MFSFLQNDTRPDFASFGGNRIPAEFPKSTQGYRTNNLYTDFPPLMSDGRSVLASWQPEAETNQRIITQNNIQTNWEYRQYLTSNALDIMRRNFVESATDVGYYDRTMSEPSEFQPVQATAVRRPFLYSTILEPSQHLGNVSSDLKESYLSREQLQAEQYSPAITQAQLLQMRQTPK